MLSRFPATMAGTGASPRQYRSNTPGAREELGPSEVHRSLLVNGLRRSRVRYHRLRRLRPAGDVMMALAGCWAPRSMASGGVSMSADRLRSVARFCHTIKSARVGVGLAKESLRKRFTAAGACGQISSCMWRGGLQLLSRDGVAGLKI